jgi:hypothetical protein
MYFGLLGFELRISFTQKRCLTYLALIRYAYIIFYIVINNMLIIIKIRFKSVTIIKAILSKYLPIVL